MRIAIVNDLPLAVEAMRRVILASRMHEIAWIAADGEQALYNCLRDRPDLILMDLVMPRIDGVESTRRIMTLCPCAILIVTANVPKTSGKVFEAMGAGALDAVNTPILEAPDDSLGKEEFLAKIETIRRLLGIKATSPVSPKRSKAPAVLCDSHLVAIGASAGGPAALASILSQLPATFTPGIVIVQHVDARFALALADWLDHQTVLRVRLAHQGDTPSAGTVLLAGADQHLVLCQGGVLEYEKNPEKCFYKPSVDVFFKSIPETWPGRVTGVLLTGMGRDGAAGLLGLRRAGHYTIAQDEATSAVYGMPRAAAELQAASRILSLEQIAFHLRALGIHRSEAYV